jgi:histidinol phosphatase-like PHP family hydrolase
MSGSAESSEKATEFALKRGLLFTAGSDAHFAGEIGAAHLEIDISERTLPALRQAVLSI